MPLLPAEQIVGDGFVYRRFRGSSCNGGNDELSKSARARGWDGATCTGLDTKLLATPVSLEEFLSGGSVFGFSLLCNQRITL